MNSNEKVYDCMIIGGGLAGLSLSILLSKKGLTVLLLEKKSYPYHKVCGEYVSMESKEFLMSLGIPIDEMNVPLINTLQLSAVSGKRLEQTLDMGGFGISRYLLDHSLASIAKESGVTLLENVTVHKYEREGDLFTVFATTGVYKGKVLSASFGKLSLGNFYRSLVKHQNWVGVKYHVKYTGAANMISLHNFNGGYCGMSMIENNTWCLCYLVKASQLKRYSNQVSVLEKEELCKNPYLKEIFENAEFLFDKPVTISNVTFSVKKPVDNNVFYLGDAAGTIAPLSGNGMSNAMRAANLLSIYIVDFFEGKYSLTQTAKAYEREWKKTFSKRISVGRWIQYLFCKSTMTTFFIGLVKALKPLRLMIIKQTHGEKF